MNIKVITPIASEPLTLSEAKTHMRIDFEDDDTYISALISVAREHCENFTGRALATQTLELILNEFPCKDYIELPMSPIQSITSIKYKDAAGIEIIWDASNYINNLDAMPARIYLAYNKFFPSFTPHPTAAVRIRYVAGHTIGNLIPKSIKQAMLLLLSHLYENREATSLKELKEVPFAVNMLLNPHKLRWW